MDKVCARGGFERVSLLEIVVVCALNKGFG
jgi:hypothetical protein